MPQSIPAGELVTVPVPVPALATVRVKRTEEENDAVTLRAALIVTTQLPVPMQAPVQPPKAEPAAGAAINVTAVPEA